MKIRTDFVTNSSSSSFIVGFKDESEIADILLRHNTGGKFYKLCNDITKHHISKEDALKNYRDNMRYDAMRKVAIKKGVIIVDEYGYDSWSDDDLYLDIICNDKYHDEVEVELDSMVAEFASQLESEGLNYFSIINYDDHCNGDLEHDIVPRLSCTCARFSYH